PDQLRAFVDRNVQYVVTSSFASERYQTDDPRRPDAGQRYQRFNRDLDEQAELVARFAPGSGGRDVPYSQDIVFTPLWDLEQYERPGPTIKIYSLAPLAATPPDTAR